MKDQMFLFRTFSVIALSSMLFVGCASKPSVMENRQRLVAPEFYTVKAGESLSSIAAKYGLNYMDIAQLNNIQAIDKIYINQSLRLRARHGQPTSSVRVNPIEQSTEIKRETVKMDSSMMTNNTQVTPTTQGSVGLANTPNTLPSSNTIVAPKPIMLDVSWMKPTQGNVLQHFDLAQNRKGIRFSGNVGDAIVAARAGEVLYADDGLPEYGKLILINHTGGYITAYAHNNALLVKVGDRVQAGQKIAEMGKTGTETVMLEFQIRLDGKPIDPRSALNIK